MAIYSKKSEIGQIFTALKKIGKVHSSQNLIWPSNVVLTIDWTYISSITINGVTYRDNEVTEIFFKRNTNISWTAEAKEGYVLDNNEGNLIIKQNITLTVIGVKQDEGGDSGNGDIDTKQYVSLNIRKDLEGIKQISYDIIN